MGFIKQLDLFIQDYSENEEEYYKLLNEIDYYLHSKKIPKSEKAREILRKFIPVEDYLKTILEAIDVYITLEEAIKEILLLFCYTDDLDYPKDYE